MDSEEFLKSVSYNDEETDRNAELEGSEVFRSAGDKQDGVEQDGDEYANEDVSGESIGE